jgi:hypothetical protein
MSHFHCHLERDHTQGRPKHFRVSKEAKKFARAKLAKTLRVNAGTINPHTPKRTISSRQMLEWLEERDEDDSA